MTYDNAINEAIDVLDRALKDIHILNMKDDAGWDVLSMDMEQALTKLKALRDAVPDGLDSVVSRLSDPRLPQGVKDCVLEANGVNLLKAAAILTVAIEGYE